MARLPRAAAALFTWNSSYSRLYNQELPHLDERVDAGDGARGAGQQLPGGEAAVAVAQVRDGAQLTEGRVVRQLSGA